MTQPSITSQYINLLKHYAPVAPYPVITTGVSLFMCLAYAFTFLNPTLIESWSLSPNCIIQRFETARFNSYPLVHVSFLHLFFNLITLYYPLAEFEVTHGSLHTAVVLNTLGAFTGIEYTIISYLLVLAGIQDERSLDTFILGSSGWAFTFLTVHCCYRSINHPTTKLFNQFNIPTLLAPFFYLLLSAIMLPGSSFLGHLISIILGILIFKNIFSKFTIPPFKIMDRIESLSIFKEAIAQIFPSEYFIWTWEHEVQSSRYNESSFQNSFGLPLHHDQLPVESPSKEAFQGQGEKVGTEL